MQSEEYSQSRILYAKLFLAEVGREWLVCAWVWLPCAWILVEHQRLEHAEMQILRSKRICGSLFVNASENENWAFISTCSWFLCFHSEKLFCYQPPLHICTFVLAQRVVKTLSSKLPDGTSICLPRKCKRLLRYFIIYVTWIEKEDLASFREKV